MYVTNLTDSPVGLSGSIVLQPKEENRYIPDTGNSYVHALRLKEANVISINSEAGFVKTFEAEAVEVVELAVTTVGDLVESVVEEVKEVVEEVKEVVEEVKEVVEEVTTKVSKTKRGAKKNGANVTD